MRTSSDYIDLNRKFVELQEGKDPEEIVFESYISQKNINDGIYDWSQLLQKKLVVILGEAGSGKTYEFKAKSEELRSKGRFSFF